MKCGVKLQTSKRKIEAIVNSEKKAKVVNKPKSDTEAVPEVPKVETALTEFPHCEFMEFIKGGSVSIHDCGLYENQKANRSLFSWTIYIKDNEMWITDLERVIRVNFCPYCGLSAVSQMKKVSETSIESIFDNVSETFDFDDPFLNY